MHKRKRICLFLLLGSLAANILLAVYERCTNTIFYFYGIDGGPVHLLLDIITVVAALILLWLGVKKAWLKIMGSLAIMVAAVYMSLLLGSGSCFAAYYTYISPDGQHRIVCREGTFGFHNSMLYLYKAENPFFIRGVFRDSYHGYARPFRDGETVVEWQDDRATVYLFGENSSADHIVTVYFDE